MSSTNKFGWMLSAVGIIIMLLPFVSGFTGLFSSTLRIDVKNSSLHVSSLYAILAGFVVAVLGLFFIKR